MKPITLKMFGLACGLGLTVILTSCSSDAPEGKKLAYTHGQPGGITVETYTTNATVTAIDPVARRLTVVSAKGDQSSYTAAPEVINFNEIRVGDEVKVTAAAELVVFLRQNGEPAADGEAALVPLAPKGAKPGGIMARTVEVTAKVTHLDYNNQRATLLYPDGTSRTTDVRKDVNLYQQKVGADVVIRTTEPLAIRVEKQ